MSWTLKVSRAAFRANRGDKQKASKASETLRMLAGVGSSSMLHILEGRVGLRMEAAQHDQGRFSHPECSFLE